MVQLYRIVRVGEIAGAELERPGIGVAVDEKRSLLVEVKTALWRGRRAAGAFHGKHRRLRNAGAVDRRAIRNQQETGIGIRGVINDERLADRVFPAGQESRAI